MLGFVGGCGPDAKPGPSSANAASPRAPGYANDEAAWGKFHSKRFQLTVPLPDGHAWKIDDHRDPELVALHAPTASRLVVVTTEEQELMNRQRCEERAKQRGWLGARPFGTVEDRVVIGPEAYDSRLWVAIDPAADRGIVGHVFLFGAFIRRCLLVHLTTSVPSRDDESVLAARLATASARIIGKIALDPPRTFDDATVPRDKPALPPRSAP